MLLTNLYSITKNVSGSKVSVFWQDIPIEIKDEFKRAFPEIDFNDTHFDLASSQIKRISSKTLVWNYASSKFKNQNLCFIDVDTLVIKDISKFFNFDFDILFTYKKESSPLNTGVMLCKGEFFEIFFKKWLEETFIILNDKHLLSQASSINHPFGGADQMSFYNLINYNTEIDKYDFEINNTRIKLIGIPCEILNETRSTKISNKTHIIHYKGGWQPILLDGKGFTKNRPKKDSWEMYLLYLKTHKMALEYFNRVLNKKYVLGSFGIRIPFYLSKIDFKENKIGYIFFYFFSKLGRMRTNTFLLGKYIVSKINNIYE